MANLTALQEAVSDLRAANERLHLAHKAYIESQREYGLACDRATYVLGQCAFGILNAASIVESGDLVSGMAHGATS